MDLCLSECALLSLSVFFCLNGGAIKGIGYQKQPTRVINSIDLNHSKCLIEPETSLLASHFDTTGVGKILRLSGEPKLASTSNSLVHQSEHSVSKQFIPNTKVNFQIRFISIGTKGCDRLHMRNESQSKVDLIPLAKGASLLVNHTLLDTDLDSQ